MPSPESSRAAWHVPLAAALLATVAVVGLTWPLFLHPATTVLDTPSLYGDASVLIQRDVNLTMWILAWDTHALTTDPTRLFHANAFHPAPWSLVFSEHMLGNLPLFGPVFLATGNPVLAHQATLLATFALAAAAMAAYVHYWTRDGIAAVVAGVVYAVAPTRLWQLGSLHVISIHLLPAVLLGLDLILDGRRGLRPVVLLVGALAVSSLCSYYVGYQAFLAAGVYGLMRVAAAPRALTLGAAARLALAAGAAAAVVGIVTLPYLWLQQSGDLPRYADRGYDSLAFLAILKFGALGLLEFFVRPLSEGIPQFLTLTAMTSAAVGLVAGRGSPRAALLVIALTGAVLSLGPVLPQPGGAEPIYLPYDWLARVVPGFSAMRAPQRFGALATLGVVALAGIGLAAARAALQARGARRLASVLAASALVAAAVEVHPGPLAGRPMPMGPSLPPFVRWLAEHGDGGAVLHLPLARGALHRESLHMYYSIFHWLPMANGYSSYPPRSYRALLDAAVELPSPDALARVLALAEPRWVVMHRRHVLAPLRESMERTLRAALEPVIDLGDSIVFEVRAP